MSRGCRVNDLSHGDTEGIDVSEDPRLIDHIENAITIMMEGLMEEF